MALGGVWGAIFSFIGKILAERKWKLRKTVFLLALAVVILGTGVSEALGFSPILTNMSIGAVLINLLYSEGETVRRTVERIMPPYTLSSSP